MAGTSSAACTGGGMLSHPSSPIVCRKTRTLLVEADAAKIPNIESDVMSGERRSASLGNQAHRLGIPRPNRQ